jgi:hypothetical protein
MWRGGDKEKGSKEGYFIKPKMVEIYSVSFTASPCLPFPLSLKLRMDNLNKIRDIFAAIIREIGQGTEP